MHSINEYPFIRISLFLICGILLAYYVDVDSLVVFNSFVFILIGFVIIKTKLVKGILYSFLVMLLGILAYNNYSCIKRKNNVSQFTNIEIKVCGKIDGDIKKFENYQRFNLSELVLYSNNITQKLSGKIQVKTDELKKIAMPGDQVYCILTPVEIREPILKNLFNYKQYLRNENVLASAYVKSDKIRFLNSEKTSFYRFSYYLKQRIYTIFNIYLNKESAALAMALITGEDDLVDSYIIEAFKNTGTMHLLAVSGMHVGLIFVILNFLFQPLKRNRILEIIFNGINLFTIWLFCCIAGLSDSVTRAGVMITFVIIGHTLNKKANTLNLVFACTFIMLLVKPTYIFNTGFQLSLSAVFGILLFYKSLKNMVSNKNKYINYVWDFSSLSIAAQIGALPITLYYFNQFPVWFLLSNMLLIPISSILIYLCIILIILSPFKVFCIYVSSLLSIGVSWFIKIIMFLTQLPYLLISDISFELIQVWLCVLSILFLYWTIYFKRFQYFKYSLLLFNMLIFCGVYNHYKTLKHRDTMVLKLRNESFLLDIFGKNYIFFGDASPENLKNTLAEYIKKNGGGNIKFIPTNKKLFGSRYFVIEQIYINDKGVFTIETKKNKFNWK